MNPRQIPECISAFENLKVRNAWLQNKTEWHRVVAFGKLAEIVGKYCVKGSQVYVSGRMKTEKYTDKEGVEKYVTKIIADRLQLLGGKSDQKPQKEDKPSAGFDDMADDCPF
jgi:single-strand DNA-binding protein